MGARFAPVYAHALPADSRRVIRQIITACCRKGRCFSSRSGNLPNGECLILTLSNLDSIINGRYQIMKGSTMTERERRNYDWTWTTLRDLNNRDGKGATAGEVGRAMGISRNTAVKYLKELIAMKTAEMYFAFDEDENGVRTRWTLYRVIQ